MKAPKDLFPGFGKPGFIKCLLSATVSDDLSALNEMIFGACLYYCFLRVF